MAKFFKCRFVWPKPTLQSFFCKSTHSFALELEDVPVQWLLNVLVSIPDRFITMHLDNVTVEIDLFVKSIWKVFCHNRDHLDQQVVPNFFADFWENVAMSTHPPSLENTKGQLGCPFEDGSTERLNAVSKSENRFATKSQNIYMRLAV